MKRILLITLTCLFIAAIFTSISSAQGEEQNPERDPVFEQEIYTNLSQINPQAATAFQQATQAMDAGDLQAAQQGYQQVLALVPDFPDAYRRLSYVELSQGQIDQAIQSTPFLILVVLAAGAGIFSLFIQAGTIPVRLALFIGLAILYTLYAIVRSIFTRLQDNEPGRPLSQDEAPRLWSITREVAERLGTRPVEAIFVTPGTEVAVTERGGFWKKVRGQGQRCLILGLAALRGMEQGHFKAILAHEYGHFSNRDTAGGNLARQVQASIHHMAYRLAMSGQARWYNPAWLFVNIFLRIFLRVTLGASRLQEILADRYAVMVFGVQNLVNGLRYLIHQDLVFEVQVGSEVQEAQLQKRALSNLYSLPQIQVDDQLKGLEEKERQILNRSTSPYDSHPAIRDRFELLKPLENVIFASEERDLVWDLLLNPDELQSDMTALVQNNLNQSRGTTS